jgi:hypothetical protein
MDLLVVLAARAYFAFDFCSLGIKELGGKKYF